MIRLLITLATTSIFGIGVPSQAQVASSHVKVGTWNNFNSNGYVHGNGQVFSMESGGIEFIGGGSSAVKPCHTCGNSGSNAEFGLKGGYNFQRGAELLGTGSFSLNESRHLGGEGSSWTQFKWGNN
jgi:hypothetical protein